MIRFPNGGDLFDFQKDASSWLLDHTLNLLNENNTLIVKAPTGSGKTIILLNYIIIFFILQYYILNFI